MASWWASVGVGAGYVLIGLICLAGVLASCLSFSGTWFVVAAAALGAWIGPGPFPGWMTIIVFALVALAVEGVEALAGTWGVKRRGGSDLAGWMALIGGLIGMVLGSLIPIPILGSLIGMLVGSFALVYWVEKARLKDHDPAAHIAMGAVMARMLMIALKVVVTLALSGVLLTGLLR